MRNSSLFLIAAAKRRERGISLDQIAKATKIGVRTLQAIEDSDFKKLPGGIYSTSYIRQYARAVDVDEAELVAGYEAFRADTIVQPEPRKSGFRSFLPALQQ